MATLNFNFDSVKELWDHARASEEHRPTYGEESPKAGLHLVKDSGIYLMSNGSPGIPSREPDAKPDYQHCVYARGFDSRKAKTPDERGELWDKCRDAVGGDDFVELIPFDTCEATLKDEFVGIAKTFKVKITESSLSVQIHR